MTTQVYTEEFNGYLRSQVTLNKITGELYWKQQSSKGTRKMSRPIGSAHTGGYLCFSIVHMGKKYYLLNHRVVFFLDNGFWPVGVDHKDRIKSNNRPDNLRECTQKLNGGNRLAKNGGKYKGVHYRKDRGTWSAQVTQNRKSVKLGTYTCVKEAALAYNYAALDYFGVFAELNNVFEDVGEELLDGEK